MIQVKSFVKKRDSPRV